jgi:hypothetical protein
MVSPYVRAPSSSSTKKRAEKRIADVGKPLANRTARGNLRIAQRYDGKHGSDCGHSDISFPLRARPKVDHLRHPGAWCIAPPGGHTRHNPGSTKYRHAQATVFVDIYIQSFKKWRDSRNGTGLTLGKPGELPHRRAAGNGLVTNAIETSPCHCCNSLRADQDTVHIVPSRPGDWREGEPGGKALEIRFRIERRFMK